MKISTVISHLRQHMPNLGGQPWSNRIAGAAEFAAVTDKTRLDSPSLYVLLGPDTAKEMQAGSTYEQDLTERFSVIAVLDNQDRRGQETQDQVHDIRTGLLSCLANWVGISGFVSCEYLGSQFLQMDRARYFHQFDFQFRGIITIEDGFQPDTGIFDSLFADWELTESDPENHPDAQDQIEDIYNE